MDKERISRFITPSAFFLASLLFGAWLDDPRWLQAFKSTSPETVAMIAGATAAGLFPLGFVITALVTIFLRCAFCLFGKNYQIALSDAAWKRIWEKLHAHSVKQTEATEIHAALVFDHAILDERVHAASVRLWTAFNIAAASCGALFFAAVVGPCALDIKWTCTWLVVSGCLFFLLLIVAMLTWRDHMGLIEFEANRLPPQKDDEAKK